MAIGREGGSEASSDDGWRPVMEEEGMAVCYSDGSHYPAGGGAPPKDGWAMVRFEEGRDPELVRGRF